MFHFKTIKIIPVFFYNFNHFFLANGGITLIKDNFYLNKFKFILVYGTSYSFQEIGIFTLDLKDFIFIFFNIFILLFIIIFILIIIFKDLCFPTYLLNFLFLFYILHIYNNFNLFKIFLFNKTFILDNSSMYFKILILISYIFFTFFFKSYYKNSFSINKDKELHSYFLLILFFSFFFLESHDLLSFFITLESSTFIIITLIFLQNYSNGSKEAGFKYFFLHGLSSSCFILTILIFIYVFKTTNYLTLLYYFLFSNIFFKMYINYIFINFMVYLAIVSLFFFIFFKFAIFPCHFWISSFYEGSSLLLLLFFTTIFKLFVLNFFFKVFFFLIIKIQSLIYITILFSIMFSSHMAFLQKKIRRYWAYSTVNNFSFFLFSTFFCNYFIGLQLGLFFIFVYIFMTFLFFFILFFTRNILTGNLIYYISELSFIRNKIILTSFVILFFSLSGLPPFLGFFSKFFIFTGIVYVNYIYIIFFYIFYSLYSSIYYLKLLKQIFFLQLNKTNKVYFFYINCYLDLMFKFILLTLLFSFKSTSFIFRFCFFYIVYLTTI